MANIDLEDYNKYIKDIEEMISTYPDPITTGGTGAAPISTGGLGSISWSPLTSIIDRRKIISDIVQDGYWIKATGSRVTKDGFTSESDWDYVVFDPDHTLYKKLYDRDASQPIEWHLGGSGRGEEFVSLKQGDINLILVDKEEVWKKYVIATNLIKTLNSKTKGERIAVFDSVFGKDKNAAAVEF